MSGTTSACVLDREESCMKFKIMFFKKMTKYEWKVIPKANTYIIKYMKVINDAITEIGRAHV